jgi:hypothetical protein
METNYSLDSIKRHPYLAAFDGEILGPLADAPRIESDTKVYDSMIYETGGSEEVSKTIIRSSAKITIRTKNIDAALTLVSNFAQGSNVMAERKVLSFTPITENENEKVLTFPSAVLLPEIEYTPTMGGDHIAVLTLAAYPDSNGKLFTYV